jgi:hypothetical protein
MEKCSEVFNSFCESKICSKKCGTPMHGAKQQKQSIFVKNVEFRPSPKLSQHDFTELRQADQNSDQLHSARDMKRQLLTCTSVLT